MEVATPIQIATGMLSNGHLFGCAYHGSGRDHVSDQGPPVTSPSGLHTFRRWNVNSNSVDSTFCLKLNPESVKLIMTG